MENEINLANYDVYSLKEAGRESRSSYLRQRVIKTGYGELDTVLDGGLEGGNFYLFLGSAKNGKSTILRSIGMEIAKTTPVLYVNFEQTGRNVYSKLYTLKYNSAFRTDIIENKTEANMRIEGFPESNFYIAFWAEKLDNKAFNKELKLHLSESIYNIGAKHGTLPIVIIENLSDIYNERIGGRDSLTNVVTQTAQDIKNFAIKHDISILLAHHTSKLNGDEPHLDDVRDSKRVVDLAHSIFSAYIIVEQDEVVEDGERYIKNVYSYRLKYIAGRGLGEARIWEVKVNGLDMELLPFKQKASDKTPQSMLKRFKKKRL